MFARIAFATVGLFLSSQSGFAQHDPVHNHAKHNMLVFGKNEIFASHLVYKQPHNFQVILKLKLPAETLQKYLAERKLHPDDTFLYLLDTMDISTIEKSEKVEGRFFRQDATNQKFDINSALSLPKDAYQLVYFDEVPLSLERAH